MESPISAYLAQTPPEEVDAACLAVIAGLTEVARVAPRVARTIVRELEQQRRELKLIASENYTSLAVQLAMGNWLTDKYAEGYPGHRFYAGCDNVDDVEAYAAAQACELFGSDHAYVQPHSGADANLVAFWAILRTRVELPELERLGVKNPDQISRPQWDALRAALGNQRLLGLDYYAGGHLTHGYRHNVSGKMFDAYSYSVDPATGLLDYDEIERVACEVKPLILLAGYSAYPRRINCRRMREIADRVGAVLMVDMAHFAGLVAGGVFEEDEDPIPFAHVVTATTHKTLRGPRGGLVLCTEEFAESVDKGCPLVIGGPLPHVMAAKAVAFAEASTPEFRRYARQVVENARALAAACLREGMSVVTGGTDNHLLLLDVRPFGLTGRQAESALRECGVTVNRNALALDPNGPWYTSGLRVGAAAVTSLGMAEAEMAEIAALIRAVLSATTPLGASRAKYAIRPQTAEEVRARVAELIGRFPVYPQLDLPFLQTYFT